MNTKFPKENIDIYVPKSISNSIFVGAGCGDWTDADSAETLRPCQSDVAKIKGEEGDDGTCKRCQGKVKE